MEKKRSPCWKKKCCRPSASDWPASMPLMISSWPRSRAPGPGSAGGIIPAFLPLLPRWSSGSAVLHRRGEHVLDGSPKGAGWGVFSPSCDASHRHPARLQQHQAVQAQSGSPAAQPVLPAAAARLLLGSDLPEGSLGAAPALGRLSRPDRGRPISWQPCHTRSRLLGDCAAAAGWTDWN